MNWDTVRRFLIRFAGWLMIVQGFIGATDASDRHIHCAIGLLLLVVKIEECDQRDQNAGATYCGGKV